MSAPKATRSALRQFCATTLCLEAFVLLFAALTAFGLRLADGTTIAAVAGIGMGLAILAAGLLRTKAGYVLGSAVQIGVIACGIVIPVMYLLGAIFTLLWIASIVLGRRIDTERAARTAAPDQ